MRVRLLVWRVVEVVVLSFLSRFVVLLRLVLLGVVALFVVAEIFDFGAAMRLVLLREVMAAFFKALMGALARG